jgi:hypothetical protein
LFCDVLCDGDDSPELRRLACGLLGLDVSDARARDPYRASFDIPSKAFGNASSLLFVRGFWQRFFAIICKKQDCNHQEPAPPAALPLLTSGTCTKASMVVASHISPKLQIFSPNTTHSAASTKRKLGERDAAIATLKRKCSGLVKYLSPAILPMAANFELLNAPVLVLEAQ